MPKTIMIDDENCIIDNRQFISVKKVTEELKSAWSEYYKQKEETESLKQELNVYKKVLKFLREEDTTIFEDE